jgi:hypothetical protein
MTARQTAVAAAADLKWLTNSAALLRRPLRYHAREAKWWGLVRLLVDRLGMTLKAAAGAATAALHAPDSRAPIDAVADASGSAALVIDLPRYESIFLANLSRALVLETPRRRGRTTQRTTNDAVSAASRYGVDINVVRSALERSPAERLDILDANVAFVRAMRRSAK